MRHLGVALAFWFVASGSASGQDKKTEKAAPSLEGLDGQIFVLFANGSGGFTAGSDALITVAREQHVPLIVQPILWCRHGAAARDHTDHEAQLAGAVCMADLARLIHKHCPKSPIYFIGHSAGTRVTLAAAEILPAGTVERIYLLGPSVSCNYDLTPALRGSRDGIVAFWTEADTLLEVAADNLGTACGQRTACAGRVGFCVPKEVAAKEKALYARFRQVQWELGMGGFGGHHSYVRESFMRRTLLPSLLVTETVMAK